MADDEEFFPPSLEEGSEGTTETSTHDVWRAIGTPGVLAIIAGPADGHSVPLRDLPIVIGRSESLADVAIDDEGMSKMHFRISREGAAIVVQDLGSSNGTLVNGTSVERARVHHGDTVGAGASLMQFVALRGPATDDATDETSSPKKQRSAPVDTRERASRQRKRTVPGMSPDED